MKTRVLLSFFVGVVLVVFAGQSIFASTNPSGSVVVAQAPGTSPAPQAPAPAKVTPYPLPSTLRPLPSAQPTKLNAAISILVVDPASAAAKLLPKALEMHNNQPIVHLTTATIGKTISTLPNSLLILHFPQGSQVAIDNPDIVAPAQGRYVYPSGVSGLLETIKPGQAILTLSYSSPAEVCNVVANCSPNWSGYVQTETSGQSFTGITGRWQVPTIANNTPNGESCTWVGIDGWPGGNNTILQAGTEQDFNPWYFGPFQSGAFYYAWFETFPDPQTLITLDGAPGDTVNPGDTMFVSITPAPDTPTPAAGVAGMWLIQITDETQKWTYARSQGYTGDLSSAEWIEEATSGPSGVQTMVNYGQVLFDTKDAVATAGGPLGSPNFDPSQEVSMNELGPSGAYSTPSNPDGDLDGFLVTYTQGAPNQVFPPGPWIGTTVLPTALLSHPYTQALQVNEASSPAWSITGLLPPGLTFNANGMISGTPTLVGTFPFSVSVTDTSTGNSAAPQGLSITVSQNPSAILQLTCLPIEGVPTGSVSVKVDGKAVSCGTLTLSIGSHTITGSVAGVGSATYTVLYAGTCNSKGVVTLVQGELATCNVGAEPTSAIESAGCPQGYKCSEPSPNGCKKCIPNKGESQ